MMRRLLLLLAPLLVAATLPPPAPLTPYIKDGRLDPRDFGWLRGRFAGASPAERAASEVVADWLRRCRDADGAAIRAELSEMGVGKGAALDSLPYRTLLCNQVAGAPRPTDLNDWPGFARDVAVATPIADAFLAAVAAAEQAAASRSPDLGSLLAARIVGEQALRNGWGWAQGHAADMPPSPTLTAQQRAILSSRIMIATAARDDDNTRWLKRIVEADGWPKRSQIGVGASGNAWLLTQHADADPAFQLRVLRLMEPLAKTGEIDRRNYAYLYDRVMLKIAGKQRYATQMTCRDDGEFVPQPLEDARNVETLRREVGLGTLAEYMQQMADAVASCKARRR